MTLMAEGMHELGLTQGRDYAFEARWADSAVSYTHLTLPTIYSV